MEYFRFFTHTIREKLSKYTKWIEDIYAMCTLLVLSSLPKKKNNGDHGEMCK